MLVRDVLRMTRRLFGSRRAIAALLFGVMVLDCTDTIVDGAVTAVTESTPVARSIADAPSNAREARPNRESPATSDNRRTPSRHSVPASRAPHAPCPCASAVPLSPAPELPRPATRDNASRPEPGDFTLPLGPALELRLRPPLAFLG